MNVRRHADVAAFSAAARELLLQDEAKHALMLGNLGYLERGTTDAADAYLSTLHAGQSVVGAALRLPSRDLVTTSLSPEGVRALVDDLQTCGAIPGIHAPQDTARIFVDAWRRTGRAATAAKVMDLCLHACVAVVEPDSTKRGRLRVADDSDLDLVTAWSEAFVADAGLPAGIDQRPAARKSIGERRVHVWEVQGRAVSMAVATGETPNGMRIGGVFTPVALRRQGHASACVAQLTRYLLHLGKSLCFLYTDLANPTSNAIYRRLGYVPVANYEEWRFEA